jgi:hypothetical protein
VGITRSSLPEAATDPTHGELLIHRHAGMHRSALPPSDRRGGRVEGVGEMVMHVGRQNRGALNGME